MALTLDQYNELQPYVLTLQRLALRYAELGELKIAKDLLTASVKASRLRPTKETPAADPAPAAPVAAVKPAKEKTA